MTPQQKAEVEYRLSVLQGAVDLAMQEVLETDESLQLAIDWLTTSEHYAQACALAGYDTISISNLIHFSEAADKDDLAGTLMAGMKKLLRWKTEVDPLQAKLKALVGHEAPIYVYIRRMDRPAVPAPKLLSGHVANKDELEVERQDKKFLRALRIARD
jgi:hypothetical protein